MFVFAGENCMADSLKTQIQIAIGEHVDFGARCRNGMDVILWQQRCFVLIFESECYLCAAAAQI